MSTTAVTESQVPAQEAQRSKDGRRRLLVVAAVAALAFAGYFGFRRLTADQQSTDDAQVEADVVPLAARVGGQVLSVKVPDDAVVKKGELLLELDPADLQARVKQAEGELAAAKAQAEAADAQAQVTEAGARGGLSTAKAQVTTTLAQVGSADAQIATVKAQLLRAEADAKKAQNDLERTRQLRAANAVPQERLDNAQSAADAAQATLAAAQAQLGAADDARRVALSRVVEASGLVDTNAPVDAKVAGARAGAELAHARVTTAEAALELARLSLGYTQVRAPSDGVVSTLLVKEGQLLAPGQPIGELVAQQTWVVANFKETQVGQMKPGQRAEVAVDAFEGRRFAGVVESLSGGTGARFSLLPPDNASGNFVKVVQRVPVRIRWVEVPAGVALRAGLSAVVTVHTEE